MAMDYVHSRQEQHSEPGTEQSACGAAGSCWSVMRVQKFASSLDASEIEVMDVSSDIRNKVRAFKQSQVWLWEG